MPTILSGEGQPELVIQADRTLGGNSLEGPIYGPVVIGLLSWAEIDLREIDRDDISRSTP
jgi:hypothetical protein